MENNYDVISVGLYDRTWDEVKAILKEMGITNVVDARSLRGNRNEPLLNADRTEQTITKEGFTYTKLPSLDGRSRDPRVHVLENLDSPVIFSKVMDTPRFRQEMATLVEKAGKGKVAILTGNANAYNGAAAKLVGQFLESTTDMKMGHVITHNSSNTVVSSQETVIDHSLGRGVAITGGDYRNISFNSDGKWSLSGDVKVGRVKRELRTQEHRTIKGAWNYGSEGEITASKGDRAVSSVENARWADYTLAISNSFTSHDARQNRLAAGDNYLQVRIPSEREAYFDEEGNLSEQLISRVSSGIRSQITKLVTRDMFGEREGFNSEAIKLNVVGANIAQIANEYKSTAVTAEELDKTTATLLRNSDTHIVEMTGPDQNLINEFLSRVMRNVREGRWGKDEFDSSEKPLFRISEVRTNGESGIAEATTIACQENGINWSIHTSKDYPWTKDNETLQGEVVLDRPSFENRFKQGYVKDISEEQMRDQAHQQTYLRSLDEGSLEPGLKDNQVALLQVLGFSNSEITQMIDIARDNNEIIMDNAQMHQFIENCGGYGISSSEHINEAAIANAQEQLADMLAKCEEKGISFITAANPLYPESLRMMQPYKDTVTEPVVTMHDGSAHIETVEREVESCRPAILWYKGDISLLNKKGLAVMGNEASSNPYDLMYADHSIPDKTESLARELGKEAAAKKVTTFTTLQDGSQMSAVNESMRHGGKSVLVSSQPITSTKLNGYAENVVQNGGLIISEQAPIGAKNSLSAGDEHLWEKRARRLSAGLSTSAVFIEGLSTKRDLNMLEAALFLGLMVSVVTINKGGKAIDDFKKRHAQDDKVHLVEGTENGIKSVVGDISEKGDIAQMNLEPNQAILSKQLPVQVLRMEGKQPIFLVPENRPDVRQAILRECGNNVQFISPSAKGAAMEALYGYPEGYAWKPGMGPYYESNSAMPQKPSVHEDVVFFDNGKIYNLATAPDKYPGLKAQKARQANISTFESFRLKAQELQGRFQKDLEMPSSAPLYLANSRYLNILPNSVEIREGSELKARVFLSDAGMIRFENIESLSTSLGEYGTSERPLLVGRISDAPKMLDSLIGQIEEALYRQGQGESDRLALATREEKEALAQEIATGFRMPGTDNIDLASKDISTAISEGSLLDTKTVDVMEREMLYYGISRSVKAESKRKSDFEKDRADIYKQYEVVQGEIVSAVDALAAKAASKELSTNTYEKISSFLTMIDEDVSNEYLKSQLDSLRESHEIEFEASELVPLCEQLYDKITRSRELMSDIQRNIAQVKELEKRIAELDRAKESLCKNETVRSCADPLHPSDILIGENRVSVPELDYSKVDRNAIREEMSKQKFFHKGTGVQEERTELGVRTYGKALPEDIIWKGAGDISIVKVGDKMAYADLDLNIISKAYDKCRPFGENCGRVEKDGMVNLVSRSGNEILAEWAQGIGSSHEGFAQVKRADGKLNLINTESFQFIGDRWFSRLDIMSNGMAMVANERGLVNYIDTDGKLFSRDEWFAKAERFSQGKAHVTCLDGTQYTVDTKGNAQSVNAIREAHAEEHVVESSVKLSRGV